MPDGLQRLFIAIPIPDGARAACQALIEPVRAAAPRHGTRWVQLETLHVTLRFLGDTEPSRVAQAGDALREAAEGREAFTIGLGGAGSFPPGRRKIRTLWLGIDEGMEPLAGLVAALAGTLAARGWPMDDRPYRPHLTIARTDATSPGDAALTAQALEEAATGWSTAFRADRVVLFRSHLGGGPPRHEPLVEVVLRDPAG